MEKKIPVNVAFKPSLIRRVKLIAASNGERPADTLERLVLAGIAQEELQAIADEKAIRSH